jgi:hypothetical protein
MHLIYMCSISLVDMDVALSRHRRSVAMVVIVFVWCFLWFKYQRQQAHSITYDPMLERDIQQHNL